MRDSNRIFGLDLLRAFAVLFVVYVHGGYLIPATLIPKHIYSLPTFDGVSIFFVLSGFLIGRILLRTVAKEDFNGAVLIEFWVRRWFRTLPNYFLVLSLLAVAAAITTETPENLIRYFSFTQNLASPHPDFFPEAWSLSVEEWFYLCIPIPLYLSSKLKNLNRRHAMLFVIFAVIVLSTAFRLYRAYSVGGYIELDHWDSNIRKQVFTRMDSLMYGVLGAYVSIFREDFWRAIATPAFVVGAGFLLFDKIYGRVIVDMFYVNYFSLTVTAAGTLLLLPKLSAWKRTGGWTVKIVTFVSLTSYSMYLLNYTPVQQTILPVVMKTVMHYLWRFEEYRVLIRYCVYWFITVLGSFLLYRYFEKPMMALRDKWPLHRRPVVSAFSEPPVNADSSVRHGATEIGAFTPSFASAFGSKVDGTTSVAVEISDEPQHRLR